MLRRLQDRSGKEDGFTLVELLVVVMLLSVIGGLVGTSLVTGMRVTSATQSRYDAIHDLQKGVDRLARELRAADPIWYPAPSSGIPGEASAAMEIYRDPPAFTIRERFTYTFCPAARKLFVRRQTPAPALTSPPTTPPTLTCPATPTGAAPAGSVPLISNVDAMTFTYQTAAGTTPTAARDVHRIIVTVRRAVPGQADINIRTALRVRNAR